MNASVAVFSEPWTQRLGWVLIHFIWQGTVIALLLAVGLRLLTKTASHIRYAVIAFALLFSAITPVITWTALNCPAESFVLPLPQSAIASVPQVEASVIPASNLKHDTTTASQRLDENLWQTDLTNALSTTLPYVVGLWLCGVLILTGRLTLGWVWTQRLCVAGSPVRDLACLERFQSLLKRMQVGVPVRLLHSAFVEVPTLIGWLRPTILIPASAFVGLTPDQLEAILAHELAHVRRYDYLVNLFQTVIETILFYHPAIWWISHKLREERENCCDDIALEIMKDRLVYASALVQLEEAHSSSPASLAMTVTGGSLLQRIKRIAGVNERKVSVWPLWILIIGILFLVCLSQTKATEPPSAQKRQGKTYLEVTYIKTVDSSALPGSRTIPKENAEPMIKNPKNEVIELNNFPLTNGVNTLSGKMPWGADFTIILNWDDSLTSKPHDLVLKIDWAHANGGEVSYGFKDTSSLGIKDVFVVTGPWKTKETSNLIIGFVEHPSGQSQKNGAGTNTDANTQMHQDVQKGDSAAYVEPSTPLKVAIDSDNYDEAKKLLDNGTRSEEIDMVEALSHGRDRIVKLLWDHGGYWCSPLSYAISQGASVVDIEAMLQKGSSLQPPEDEYLSPLAVAVAGGNLPVMTMLLDHGADPNWKGEKYSPVFSPLMLAVSARRPDMVSLLLDRNANQGAGSIVFAALGNASHIFSEDLRNQAVETVNVLAEHGMLERVSPKMKGQILNMACLTAQNPELVRLLLAHGFSPNEIGPDGKTPVIELVRRASEGKGNWPASPAFMPILRILEGADKGTTNNSASRPAVPTPGADRTTPAPASTSNASADPAQPTGNASPNPQGVNPKDTPAIINGHVITANELKEQWRAVEDNLRANYSGKELQEQLITAGRQMMQALIDRWLILDAFKAEGGYIHKADTDERIDDIVRYQFGGDRAAFLQTLAQRGQTLDSYREQIEDNAVVGYMRGKFIEPKLEEYYQGHLDLFPADEFLRITTMVIKGSVPVPVSHTMDFASESDPRAALAREVQRKMQAGEDVSSVIPTEGTDPDYVGKGRWVTQERFPSGWPITWSEVEKLKAGETTNVAVSDGSFYSPGHPEQNYHFYYIVRLEERRPTKIAATAETAKEDKAVLEVERQRLQNEWLGPLREKAKIQIFDAAVAIDPWASEAPPAMRLNAQVPTY